MNYRHVGSHPEDTAEGATIGPGESTEVLGSFNPLHPLNKRLIDEGILIEIPETKQKDKTGGEG